ncbi:hypothetical protein JOE11_004243 [Robbsia andropogonis]
MRESDVKVHRIDTECGDYVTWWNDVCSTFVVKAVAWRMWSSHVTASSDT